MICCFKYYVHIWNYLKAINGISEVFFCRLLSRRSIFTSGRTKIIPTLIWDSEGNLSIYRLTYFFFFLPSFIILSPIKILRYHKWPFFNCSSTPSCTLILYVCACLVRSCKNPDLTVLFSGERRDLDTLCLFTCVLPGLEFFYRPVPSERFGKSQNPPLYYYINWTQDLGYWRHFKPRCSCEIIWGFDRCSWMLDIYFYA